MVNNNKNRIILFCPQPTAKGRRLLPINLLAISSYLVRDGYRVEIYHSADRGEWMQAIASLDDVICVGISSMTGYQIIDGLNFAQKIRDKDKGVPIIWGGVHPTVKPRQTLKHRLVDIVIRGQGEDTFYELVKCLKAGQDLGNVLGIAYKNRGQIIEHELRPLTNINDLPPLPYHIIEEKIERYIKPGHDAKRILPIVTSDGCPYRCSFCYMSMPEFSRGYVAFSAEKVVGQIEYLVKRYNLDGIRIGDSNFFIDPDRARGIFKGVVDKKLKIALIDVNVRVDQLLRLTDEDWRLMEKAGVKELLVGTESGDQEMLDLINKNITVEDIIKCEKKAVNFNINIINSFITGFPPKDKDRDRGRAVLKRELYNTVDLISQIIDINPLTTNMLFFYTPYPGTPLYQLCLDNGFKEPPDLEGWGRVDLSQKNCPWITDEHVKKTLYYEKLFLIKKLTSSAYVQIKIKAGDKKYRFLHNLGMLQALNYLATLRIRYKFLFFPFEKYILN